MKLNKITLLISGASALPICFLSAGCNNTNKPNNENDKKTTVTNESKAQEINKVINEFTKEQETRIKDKNALLAPTKEESKEIGQIIDKYIAKLEKIDLKEVKDLDSNLIAWLDGVKYNLEIMKGNYTSNIRYLLPSYKWGTPSSYVANAFYHSIILRKKDSKIASRWLATLKEAIDLGIVPSKVFIKNNINKIVSSVYYKKIVNFLNDTSKNEITIKELIGFDETKKESEYTEQDWLDKFYTFYATTYYQASKYGEGENIAELKLTKSNTLNEKEWTIEVNRTNVYGLGLTDKDLNQKKAGLGYIPKYGPEIYANTLKMATTSSLSAQQVYDKGHLSTISAKNNTVSAAKKIAEIITGTDKGEWKETIKYDSDGLGQEDPKDIELTIRKADGEININEFYKWLNAEDFFFGREESSVYSDDFINTLKSSTGGKKGVEELKQLGYAFLIDNANADKKYGSITNKQFYYGALSAFDAYYQFKESTVDYGASFFAKEVKPFEIKTYNYEDRNSAGVGAYEDSIMKFVFNADPYYSLQKWSVSSFANHESMMGHHNQIYYAKQHLAKVGNEKLADTFDYTSYIEGWALFMEWFGIETGYYGTPDYNSDNYYAMPVDFTSAKGITNFLTAEEAKATTVSADDIKSIKELHNGVYWNKVNSKNKYTSDESLRAKKAVELCNILQFIGALNEAQLRNMRLAVDTAYHGGNVVGKEGLEGGASIMDARKFLESNSALGKGDITSETVRYFNCVSQATSYNSGKEIFMDLYKSVAAKLKKNRKEFVEENNHQHIKDFLDVVLRNSALPMGSVQAIVKYVYDLK